MPRYFFHIRSPKGDRPDQLGETHPDEASAQNEARMVASEILRDAALNKTPIDETLEVTDEQGRVVLRFKCSDVEQGPKQRDR